ncbi:hypothetical protein HDU76_011874 [Blyttiomyces sp. JEL0837]|nr:hypothetical protein HDU76_011874 [Blyttiomyces sp. JEL0837]
MNCGIIGFEEVFNLEPLIEAAKRAGYDMSKTTIISPSCNGIQPAVGLLSVYPIVEYQLFEKFPDEAVMDLNCEGDGEGGADPVLLPVTRFSRAVLRVLIEIPTGHRLAVYVTHMKSKRPMIPKDRERNQKSTAVGSALSLIIRAAEAAALRCIIVDELEGRQEDVVAAATLSHAGPPHETNHRHHTSEPLTLVSNAPTGTGSRSPVPLVPQPPTEVGLTDEMEKLNLEATDPSTNNGGRSPSMGRARGGGRSRSRSRARREVSTVNQVSADRKHYTTIVMGDLNDVTHAVSTEIISGTTPFKRLPFWEKQVMWRTLLYSTHDVQVRAADRDVNYTYIHNGRYESLDNILVSNDLVRLNPNHIGYVQFLQCFNDHLVDATLAEDDDDYDSPLTLPPPTRPPRNNPTTQSGTQTPTQSEPSSPPQSPTLKHRAPRLRGRDVTKSDHGQVVALLKIFPKGVSPSTEYDPHEMRPTPPPREPPVVVDRFGGDGMGDLDDGEGVAEVLPRERSGGVDVQVRAPGRHRRLSFAGGAQDAEEEIGEDAMAELVADGYYAKHGDPGGVPVKLAKHQHH